MTDPLASWTNFSSAVRSRLEKGREDYGDASFERPPEELVREVEEELLDVCGWSFVLWTRLHALGEKMDRKENGINGNVVSLSGR